MSNIVKASDNLMAPIAAIVPELLKNAMPAPVPQMSWESGFLQDFFHNWKLGRLEKASQREAGISQNKYRDVKAKLDTIHEVVTFSKRMETSIKQYNHQMTMMDIEEDKAKAELMQVQLKNMLLQGEVKLNEVELKIKLKEMEDLCGGTSET